MLPGDVFGKFYMVDKNKRILLGLALTIILVTALPYLVLSLYNVPITDDFLYAAESRDLGAWGAMQMWYNAFTGRYTSSMIMSLLPFHHFNFICAQIVPLILIINLIISLYYCIHAFKFFSRLQALLLCAVIFSVYLSTMVSPAEVIFWLSGSITYTLPIIILLYLWGYIIRVYSSNGKTSATHYWWILLGCSLLSGTNEVIIFYHGFLAFWFLVYTWYVRSRYNKLALVIFSVTTVCSLFSLLAPGNSGRHEYMVSNGHASPTLLHSLIFTLNAISIWLYLRTKRFAFMVLILAVPAILLISKQPFDKRSYLKLHPLWLIAIFFAGNLFAYLPVTISLTEYFPDRTLDCIYFTYIVFAVVSLGYTGVYYGLDTLGSKGFRRLSYALLFLGLVALVADRKTNTAKGYETIFTQKNVIYKQEMDARLRLFDLNQGKKMIKVAPVSANPRPMAFSDVDTVLHGANNFGYETYFKIDTVLSTSNQAECLNCD